MTIKSFTFNPFQTNCFVLHDGQEAIIIDPSCHTKREIEEVLGYIDVEGVEVKHLLLTHGHIDHIYGCSALAEAFDDGFKMHREDLPLLEKASEHAAMFGTHIEEPPPPTDFLAEGDAIHFGDRTLEILFTPGHSPGSICFLDKQEGILIGGDVLFYDSIGRTDLWRGSLPELMASIYQKLMVLPDDTNVYPGHGPETTIGRERQFNPFLQRNR